LELVFVLYLPWDVPVSELFLPAQHYYNHAMIFLAWDISQRLVQAGPHDLWRNVTKQFKKTMNDGMRTRSGQRYILK